MSDGLKLTPRDKILLVVMGVLLVSFLCGYYIYMPKLQYRAEQVTDLNTAKLRRTQSVTNAQLSAAIKVSVEALQLELDDTLSKLLTFTSTESIEADFTRFLMNNNMTPETVRVTEDTRAYDDGELLYFTLNITAIGELDALLSVLDYVNSQYSYSLTRMTITGNAPSMTAAYVLRVVLMAA